MRKPLRLVLVSCAVFAIVRPVFASTSIDLSKAANRSLSESFDTGAAEPGSGDLKEKNGLKDFPTGSQIFRGVPFQIIDPKNNQGRSFVALKSRRKPDFPEGVSIPTGEIKAAYLYFLHTCRWGGTASNITVAEYDIIYDDGQIAAVPLRVGVEFTNFFNPVDTSVSYLAWWHKYKNIEMGVNFFPWKNPHPEKFIQSILFKSRGNMPVPILFAITASDHELPISAESPKPEKTFQTDTSKWIPFQSSGALPTGTAIDMGFLLDAPAGKHGKVKADGDKLVFEDGTPAKFWGVPLPNPGSSNKSSFSMDLVDRLAASGCNAVLSEAELDTVFLKALKTRGIYVFSLKPPEKTGPAPTTAASLGFSNDPAVIDGRILNWGKRIGNSDGGSPPFVFDDVPLVMAPEKGLPIQLIQDRYFGKPFSVQWEGDWPNEFLAEIPLAFVSNALLGGWSASFGMKAEDFKIGILGPEDRPQVLIQWPTAALAFLRGDLKEGKVFVLDKDGSGLKALAHKSGLNPEGGKFKTDRSGELKAKVNEKTKSFVSDTGQISWQGNVGVVKVEAPRFQALIGFLSHRKFNNPYWAVETPNLFASLSAISLTNKPINTSDHLLLTGVTRMENTGQIYNADKTKLLSAGKAPILVEPLSAKFVLYRFAGDPKLKIRALDADGQPLKTKVPAKWVKNNFVFSWVPSAVYLEIYK